MAVTERTEVSALFFVRGPWVWRTPGRPCALCSQEGQGFCKTRTQCAPRIRTSVSTSSCPGHAGAIRYAVEKLWRRRQEWRTHCNNWPCQQEENTQKQLITNH